jgi:antirestriction protein
MSISTTSGPSVCVSCMACHNEGRGLGKWITAEQVAAEVDAEAITYGGQGEAMTYGSGAAFVGCKICGGDEWDAVDVENTPHGFRGLREFYANAAELMGLADFVDIDAFAIFAAWYNAGGHITDLEELIAEHQDRYHGEWRSMRDYAEEYAEGSGMLQGLPDHLARYFDFDAFASDLEHDLYYEGGHIWSAN